jgi:hypothetical protein
MEMCRAYINIMDTTTCKTYEKLLLGLHREWKQLSTAYFCIFLRHISYIMFNGHFSLFYKIILAVIKWDSL